MIKEFLLIGAGVAQMLRVPLNGDAEGVLGIFQRFDEAVFTAAGCGETGGAELCRLMVEAVDPDRFRQQGG